MKEQMFVKGTDEEKEENILNQDVAEPDNSIRSFGNPFQVSTNDMPKHRLEEPPSFSLGPEFDDFSIEEINQTNVKDANITINRKIESRVAFSETETDCSQKEKQSLDRIQTVSFRPEARIWGSALNTNANNLSQAEALTADTLFIMDEESDPVIFLESLAPGLKIEKPVIDAWADLLNFDERYKSAGSPSRYFFKPILVSTDKSDGSVHGVECSTTVYLGVEYCLNLLAKDEGKLIEFVENIKRLKTEVEERNLNAKPLSKIEMFNHVLGVEKPAVNTMNNPEPCSKKGNALGVKERKVK
ncbi:hypothetical protein Tco_1153817 [Tanacetum coccineum]